MLVFQFSLVVWKCPCLSVLIQLIFFRSISLGSGLNFYSAESLHYIGSTTTFWFSLLSSTFIKYVLHCCCLICIIVSKFPLFWWHSTGLRLSSPAARITPGSCLDVTTDIIFRVSIISWIQSNCFDDLSRYDLSHTALLYCDTGTPEMIVAGAILGVIYWPENGDNSGLSTLNTPIWGYFSQC